MLRVSRAVASVVALEARTKTRRVCFQIRCLVVDCVVGDNSEHGIEALKHCSVHVGLHYLWVCIRSGGVASIGAVSVVRTLHL